MIVGKQSILFEENVYIEETACVAGQKESEGPLGKLFDVVVEDAMAGMENWEEAESTLQQLAVDKLLEKWDGKKEDLRYIFAGDLLGQLIATSFGLMQYEIPMFGLYGACSTFGEALSLAAMQVTPVMSLHWLPVILQVPKNSSVIRWNTATSGHRLRHGQLQAAGQPLSVRKKARSVSAALRPEK